MLCMIHLLQGVVTKACVGQQTCQVPASCKEFDEEKSGPHPFCWDIEKSLAVKVSCKTQAQDVARPVSVDLVCCTIYVVWC